MVHAHGLIETRKRAWILQALLLILGKIRIDGLSLKNRPSHYPKRVSWEDPFHKREKVPYLYEAAECNLETVKRLIAEKLEKKIVI